MTNSWEESKKKGRPIGRLILAGIIAVGAGLLIWNNSDTFMGRKAAPKSESDAQTETVSKEEIKDTTQDREQVQDEEKETAQSSDTTVRDEGASVAQEPQLLSVSLPTVVCHLGDNQGPPIRVSLKLYFSAKKLEKEILFKRDAINLMVKKVLAKKHLSDIVVDALRAELQKEINALLTEGTVTDIEFLDFQPGG